MNCCFGVEFWFCTINRLNLVKHIVASIVLWTYSATSDLFNNQLRNYELHYIKFSLVFFLVTCLYRWIVNKAKDQFSGPTLLLFMYLGVTQKADNTELVYKVCT